MLKKVIDNHPQLIMLAGKLYEKKYFSPLRLHQVNQDIANELYDSSVNLGQGASGKSFQRALNILNRNQKDYPDIAVDGAIGQMTISSYDSLMDTARFKSRNKEKLTRWLIKWINFFQMQVYYKHITEYETKTETKIDTLILKDTVHVPEWHTKTIIESDTILDTVLVYIDYNTEYYYYDTLQDDSNAFIAVNDIIYQNKIKSRKTSIQLYNRTILNTVTIPPPDPRIKVFAGIGVSGNMNMFGASGQVGLLTKREQLYTVYYDPFNKVVGFGMYWKIRIKR